mmetsp:Transcript_50347/g.155602  ORF Transcript_50347/g.155602 Transcript_50347/m.155602 type:complete len:224 (-) Transcript_50347:1875-2546(-)
MPFTRTSALTSDCMTVVLPTLRVTAATATHHPRWYPSGRPSAASIVSRGGGGGGAVLAIGGGLSSLSSAAALLSSFSTVSGTGAGSSSGSGSGSSGFDRSGIVSARLCCSTKLSSSCGYSVFVVGATETATRAVRRIDLLAAPLIVAGELVCCCICCCADNSSAGRPNALSSISCIATSWPLQAALFTPSSTDASSASPVPARSSRAAKSKFGKPPYAPGMNV